VIVIGIDPHKKTHTAVAVDGATGELIGQITVPARGAGHERLLAWARRLSGERLFAIEDCRHVSLGLESLLVVSGERSVRVPPRMMGRARASARTRGKSDPIDAAAVARAALAHPDLPRAALAGPEREIRLLVDYRDRLVGERTGLQQSLRWRLHELAPELEIPAGALDRRRWLDLAAERLGGAPQGPQRRLAEAELDRCRALCAQIRDLEREISALVAQVAPELLGLPGCGPLTAAKLVGEIAGAGRFASPAKLAMHAGVAPLVASSGTRQRHRLNRSGNRQLNCALHRVAVTQGRVHDPARQYLARKESEGKGRMEALRCLKRHLANVIWRLLTASPTATPDPGRPLVAPGLT
jgi:transposase